LEVELMEMINIIGHGNLEVELMEMINIIGHGNAMSLPKIRNN